MRKFLPILLFGLVAGCSKVVVAAPPGQEVYLVPATEGGVKVVDKHARYIIGLVPSVSYEGCFGNFQFFTSTVNTTDDILAKYGVRKAHFLISYSIHDFVVSAVIGAIPVVGGCASVVATSPRTIDVYKVE